MKCVLCIPTLNPGNFVKDQVQALINQELQPNWILIIDSNSDDGSIETYKDCGADIQEITRNEFNHGTTRQMALQVVPEAQIIIYLTQDAIPANSKAFSCLLKAFDDPKIGAVYGRQLPSANADAIAMHGRQFNYSDSDLVKTSEDIPCYGIKTVFFSNSFSAYRRVALEQVGGFPSSVIMGEDTCVAARMILAGWKIAYQASAAVYHSHNYSKSQEFRRYFDTGVIHSREPWIRKNFGGAGGEGRRFVQSEFKYLWKTAKWHIPDAFIRSILKLLAFRLGLMEKIIPYKIKRILSYHRSYWQL